MQRAKLRSEHTCFWFVLNVKTSTDNNLKKGQDLLAKEQT